MRDVQTTVNYITNRIDAEVDAARIEMQGVTSNGQKRAAEAYIAGLEYAKTACIEATTRTKEQTM